MLSRRLQRPVRCFIASEPNSDTDEQISRAYPFLQRRVGREMANATRVGLWNDTASRLSRDDRSIEHFHQLPYFVTGVGKHGATAGPDNGTFGHRYALDRFIEIDSNRIDRS